MGHSGQYELAVAQLVVYLVLAPPLLYILVKHGKHGILGWVFSLAFVSLLIVANGILVGANDQPSSASDTAEIIASVGLSPLLIAVMGVLHEVDYNGSLETPAISSIIFQIVYHLEVGGAVALAASGASGAFQTPPTDDGVSHYRVGAFLFLVALIVLVVLTAATSLRSRKRGHQSPLLVLIIISLPLVFLRVLYIILGATVSIPSAFTPGPQNSLAAKVILEAIPGMLIMTMFVIGGFLGRPDRHKNAVARNNVSGISRYASAHERLESHSMEDLHPEDVSYRPGAA